MVAAKQSTTESFSGTASDWFQLSLLNIGNTHVFLHCSLQCSVGLVSVKVNSDTKYLLSFLRVSQTHRVLKSQWFF